MKLIFNPFTGNFQFAGAAGAAAALLLKAYAGSETIPDGQFGLGWTDDGKMTLFTPYGAFQFGQSEDPATPTIYWPGKIVCENMTSTATFTALGADQIIGGSGLPGGLIQQGIMDDSLATPLYNWVGTQTRAGANGIPYAATAPLSSYEPVAGTYIPAARVDDLAEDWNPITGIYFTVDQLLALFATKAISGATLDATNAITLGGTDFVISNSGNISAYGTRILSFAEMNFADGWSMGPAYDRISRFTTVRLNAATPTSTLTATPSDGAEYRFIVTTAGEKKIQPPAAIRIYAGGVAGAIPAATPVTGYLSCSDIGSSITLQYSAELSAFVVVAAAGAWNLDQ